MIFTPIDYWCRRRRRRRRRSRMGKKSPTRKQWKTRRPRGAQHPISWRRIKSWPSSPFCSIIYGQRRRLLLLVLDDPMPSQNRHASSNIKEGGSSRHPESSSTTHFYAIQITLSPSIRPSPNNHQKFFFFFFFFFFSSSDYI